MSIVKKVCGLGILAGSLLLGGCRHDDWMSYGHDSSHSAHQPHEKKLDVTTAKTLNFTTTGWLFQSPGGSFVASPTVYDGTVYIGDGVTGIFYAVHARGPNQGKLRWQYPPAVAPSPADACGTTTAPLLITSVPFGNPSGPGIASSAAVSEDVAGHTAVVFGAPDPNSNGGDGRLWALDARTGQCIWKSAVIAPTSGTAKIGYSSPVIAHDRAYVGVAALYPDSPITIGQLFSVKLSDGTLDPAVPFSASGSPAGGGIWSSPVVTPSGNLIVTTGNSCVHSNPDCSSSIPLTDYTMSMVKLDWHNWNVLWQLQPVDIHYDNDPDYASSPMVAKTHCGTLAVGVQKDGYVHAVHVRFGGFHTNPACSYAGHNLECPRWTFPPVPSLPFQSDGHGDTRFIRAGAFDRDHVFITAGGYNLTEITPPPGNLSGNVPGRIILNRLYSLDACASDDDRIRWIYDLNGDAAGAPSVANGLIYVGADTEFDTSATPHEFYVLADIDVVLPTSFVCSYPLGPAGSGFPVGPACAGAGFKPVPVPQYVVHFPLTGAMPGHPAIAEGRVFVATTAGYLYGLAP
jgi:outer membrane protein assembly factor BamB